MPDVPLGEQRRIATRLKAQLEAAEDLRRAAEAQREDIAALPGRLLSQAFQTL
jgi:hypothetical protein